MIAEKKKARPIKKFFKKNLISILIYISIALFAFSFIAPYLFTSKLSILNQDFNTTGAIGDTVGGLMNPFIALSGVCVTFLAFFMQYKANKIQVKNFRKEQKKNNKLLKEQLFFRLFENLNQRIVNFSYSENNDRDYSSYTALTHVTKTFKASMDGRLIKFGRQLLIKMPERIPDTNLRKLVDIDDGYDFRDYVSLEDFKSLLIEKSDVDRADYLSNFIRDRNDAFVEVNSALASIGRVMFYKLDLFEKEELYFESYDYVYNTYGGFIDGYIKNLRYLLRFIEKNDSKDFFFDYMVSNMTTQEFVIIYYHCASRKSGPDFKRLVKKYGLLNDLHLAQNNFVDSPSEEELSKEIEEILNYEAEEMLNYYQRTSKDRY
ncbi:putative phage abortive infection protein [Sphingobacterium siyangense]|uniref:putative phage abortive infection protein n=1 Tax=Sphingobacterium siyangense TaxID=459529 RepID=UPI0019645C2D|nr:putative phage abortive infection protein [Sphingobacterium siyangense]QRY55960.1 hypothetical protein JVX97_18245 [Sphingobacterium siyangense]